MTKLATASMSVVYDKQTNLKKYLTFIDEAAAQGADLLVFPEQSLQGYLPSSTQLNLPHYQYQYENAEIVPGGASVRAICEKAAEANIHIVFGMTEKDEEFDYMLFNTAVLAGPDGYIGKYRKVHRPLDEIHMYYAGEEFPVFQTKIGRISMLICFDKVFPESAREAALGGAQIIVVPVAWGGASITGETTDLENDPGIERHRLFDRVRAIENQIFLISSNCYGNLGATGYLGNSNIVNPSGVIVATTGCKECIAYADVDLDLEIYNGKTIAMMGSNLIRERRPLLYKRLRGE